MARGPLVPNVKYVLVPNRRPPSKEGHLLTDNTEARRPRVFLVGRHKFEKISVEFTEVD